jgi:hypothetical protein
MSNQKLAEDANRFTVSEIIRRSENPHPLMLVFIIIIIMIVAYCIYVQVIKKSASGDWLDDAEKSRNICHNMWRDTILVDGKYHGIVKGHLIIIYIKDKMRMGVWIKDRISWTDGQVWMCEKGY